MQVPVSINHSLPQNVQNSEAAMASFANHTSEDCLCANLLLAQKYTVTH